MTTPTKGPTKISRSEALRISREILEEAESEREEPTEGDDMTSSRMALLEAMLADAYDKVGECHQELVRERQAKAELLKALEHLLAFLDEGDAVSASFIAQYGSLGNASRDAIILDLYGTDALAPTRLARAAIAMAKRVHCGLGGRRRRDR